MLPLQAPAAREGIVGSPGVGEGGCRGKEEEKKEEEEARRAGRVRVFDVCVRIHAWIDAPISRDRDRREALVPFGKGITT